MSFKRSEQPHRSLFHAARMGLHSQPEQLLELDNAYEAHIKAKLAWDLSNTDETMIRLISTWARVTRLINKANQ